jgi:chromosome segregation ATPase
MVSGVIEGGMAILIALIGAAVIFGQVRENAKRNEDDINSIKTMMKEFQDSMMDLLSNNMSDMKALLDTQKEHQKEALEREITHLKDLIAISSNETRADIQRLQQEQKESNNLKTKLAILTQSVKSLHHRLDLDPPATIDDED